MRTLLAASTLALLFAQPASAVIVTFTDVSGAPGTVTVFNAADNLLQLDLVLQNGSNATIEIERTAGDGDLIDFDSFVEFAAGLGINTLNFEVTFNAAFASLGSAEAAFSDATVTGDSNRVFIDFDPIEFVSVDVGGALGSGTPFVIDISNVAVGDSFTLFVTAVPAPAAFALFGLGLGALALRRR